MKCNTILFDLDGTLLNTLTDLTISTNLALEAFGFCERTEEEVRGFVGNGVRKLIERAIPEGAENRDFDACFQEFLRQYELHLDENTAPYEGILPVLGELAARGYKMGIVSNKIDSAVRRLNQIYFESVIGTAVGASEHIAKKPAPDTLYQAMRELDSKTELTVYVGDSEVDVMTAANAGIPCLSVSWGFRSKDQLKAAGAGVILDQPKDLLQHFPFI